MAKQGKLGKFLKKMQSIGRAAPKHSNNEDRQNNNNNLSRKNSNIIPDVSKSHLPVYVGKTRRFYMVRVDVVDHPLFRELVDRSTLNNNNNNEGYNCEEISVGCEVVLFEHLLWMLENGETQPDSLDELVDFYAC